MKCFHFFGREKRERKKEKEEPKTPKPNSRRSSVTTSRRSRVEARGNNQSPNLSSNLKVFTLSELKQITRNFSNSAKLGEGGFGCVFKGVIKNSEDPYKKIDVAIKQLGKLGRQVNSSVRLLILHFFLYMYFHQFLFINLLKFILVHVLRMLFV